MLEPKLKELARPTLDEETKARHLASLQAEQNQAHKKQTWGYVTTLFMFAVLVLFLFQTLQTPTPHDQKQADVLTVDPLKKASYLYSTNAERNYRFPSLFLSDDMTTTDPEKLRKLEDLLNGLQKIPYTEQLTRDEGATHYMLQQVNGENLYLKSVSRAEESLLINVTTNEQIVITKEQTLALERIWLQIYAENLDIPKWKYVALVVLFISLFFFKPKLLAKEKTNGKLIIMNLVLFLILLYCYITFTRWYGVVNIPVLQLLYLLFSTVEFSLAKLWSKTQQTWKEHFVGVLQSLLLLTILFI